MTTLITSIIVLASITLTKHFIEQKRAENKFLFEFLCVFVLLPVVFISGIALIFALLYDGIIFTPIN